MQWFNVLVDLKWLVLWYIHIGIQPWEDKYEEMAKAMGIDPSVTFNHTVCTLINIHVSIQTKKYVPFVPSDKEVCIFAYNNEVHTSSAIAYNVVCDQVVWDSPWGKGGWGDWLLVAGLAAGRKLDQHTTH